MRLTKKQIRERKIIRKQYEKMIINDIKFYKGKAFMDISFFLIYLYLLLQNKSMSAIILMLMELWFVRRDLIMIKQLDYAKFLNQLDIN